MSLPSCRLCLQVYHMMQAVIFEHTALLYNRHLDQLLLSAIYGICKVEDSLHLVSGVPSKDPGICCAPAQPGHPIA